MIAHEVTASLYIQTRTSQAQEHIPTATHNNNNGGAKNLNAHEKNHPIVCQTVRRRYEETNVSQDLERISQGLHFGHQVSRPSRIRLSWPQLSQKSLPWPDWKTHTQKSLEWVKSVQWKPDWLKGSNLEEEIMSASRTLRSELRKAKDSLTMHRVPIGDWLSLKDQVLEGSFVPSQPAPPLPPPPRIRRRCVPSVVVYDTGLCTREEDDPAHAVLYFRPRHTPTTARTSLAGQLAGVVHFCRQAFDTPTVVRTRHAHVAFKDYGRFVLMVCGRGGEWARGRLLDVCRQLDAATGGLPHLWLTCGWDHRHFTDRLTEVLDGLLPNAIPDADFGEEDGEAAEGPLGSSPNTTPLSTPSPATEASELGALEDDTEARKRMGELEGEEGEEGEGEALKRLHRIFNAVPSVQLPKSGGGVFLKAQQVVEACQQQPGVLAGATMHKNRVLNTQMDSELTHVLASLPLHVSKGGVLEERNVDYRLPADVHLLKLHVPAQTHAALRKHMPKPMPRRGERGLHSEAASMDLASLRSVLQTRQSLHSYPSSLPVAPEVSQERSASPQPQPPPRGPSLLARISGGLEAELRPSQSLPGSPRKIRVAATLPDVGTNSPDLRYKVLTGRRPRPPASSHSTPRRMPGGRNGIPRNHDGSSNGFNGTSKRSHGLCPPSLTRGDKRNNKLISEDGGKNPSKLGYDSEKSESGFEDGVQSDSELNIKNTKNKLNLHLAPDKINRPSHEIELDGLGHDEPKIRREINGNLSKDDNPSSSPNGNLPTLKTQLQDLKDESDTSRSEESDISVLDLSKYVETKENGDRQLAEAVKGLIELTSHSDDEDARLGQGSGSAELRDSGDEDNSAEGWRALTLYTQKLGDTVLHLLLSSAAYSNPQLVYTLWRLGLSGLEDVQKAVERALEVSEGGCGGDAFIQYSYSVLSAVTPCTLEHKLISVVHEDFSSHRDLMEVTIRSDEAVMWGHRHSNTETFYQVSAAPRPGLPIPSDVMAKVPHRARRRLDRDHNITLL
ncbi:uncharacterized protein LOC135107351 [Scylla paramamosain]|uniref:uncharacterized protein LOC135107351 n=1 Tax=Scylla paramamosain TaxID=85552 RepID=UPI003083DC14